MVLCAGGAALVAEVAVQMNGHVEYGREYCRGAVYQSGSGAQLQACSTVTRVGIV